MPISPSGFSVRGLHGPLCRHLRPVESIHHESKAVLARSNTRSAIGVLIGTLAGIKAWFRKRHHSDTTTQRRGFLLSVARPLAQFAAADARCLRGKICPRRILDLSCIKWLRTLPYVRAWAEKYKDQGLVVIGVHTPEFEFEKMSTRALGRKGMKVGFRSRSIATMGCGVLSGISTGQPCISSIRRGNPTPSIRRRWLRAVGKDHSTIGS